MFTEDDFILISALQHYVYCPRQCALIHVEDAWNENVFTVRGNILHEKVDSDTYETRGTIKTVRGLRIHSFKYGLVGRCDVVEFRRINKRGDSGFRRGHSRRQARSAARAHYGAGPVLLPLDGLRQRADPLPPRHRRRRSACGAAFPSYSNHSTARVRNALLAGRQKNPASCSDAPSNALTNANYARLP